MKPIEGEPEGRTLNERKRQLLMFDLRDVSCVAGEAGGRGWLLWYRSVLRGSAHAWPRIRPTTLQAIRQVSRQLYKNQSKQYIYI